MVNAIYLRRSGVTLAVRSKSMVSWFLMSSSALDQGISVTYWTLKPARFAIRFK